MSSSGALSWHARRPGHVPLARAWALAAGGGMVFFVLHVTTGLGGAGMDGFASTWVYDAIEVLAFVAVAARAATISEERIAWLAIAVGIASWTMGDISWSVFYGGNPPFPSAADVFYLGFYPPTYLGLALLVRRRHSRFNASIWLDGVMAALAVASIGSAVLLEVILDRTHGRLLAVATNLAYPLADIVLVALVVGVFGLAGWRPGRSWSAIGAALALTATADSIYLYESAVGAYSSGALLDALWPASILLLAVAAWIAPGAQKKIQLEGRPLAATPAVCGVAALAVLVDSHVQQRNIVGVALAAATIVTVIARTLLTFRENARITGHMNTLATTDALTGLPNRRKLLDDLHLVFHEESDQQRVLALYDLNGFKAYNDTFGHPAGDALLRRLAWKLEQAVEPYGTGYRLGGDEFCVLGVVASSALDGFLAATTAALGEKGEGFEVSTAFGCVFLPEEAVGPSEALRIADQRLYAQKYQSQIARGRPHRVLLQALYEREPYLREHGEGVARLSLLVAAELGLPDEALEEIELAAELHDIGKLAIPDATLLKRGPLDEDEWAFIRRHTIVGQRILNASPALNLVGKVVRATHERWDGTGYPDGLRGAEIPLAARIVTVCDAYSAMTCDRSYRAARPAEVALAELRACAGTQFDPDVVAAFEAVHATLRPAVGAA